MKRNNGNIFGLFVFWKAKAKTMEKKHESETKRKRKDGYTNVR